MFRSCEKVIRLLDSWLRNSQCHISRFCSSFAAKKSNQNVWNVLCYTMTTSTVFHDFLIANVET